MPSPSHAVLRTPKRIWLLAAPFAAFALVACSSAPSTGGGATGTPSPVSTTSASQPAGTSGAATTVPATPAATQRGAGKPDVALAFTGSKPFGATGNWGRCILIKDATGKVTSFGWEATEADIPGIGQSFSLAQFPGNTYVDIKWVIDGSTAYTRPQSGTVELSADGHTVTMDTDLAGMTPVGGTAPGPEHVKGTVTCP